MLTVDDDVFVDIGNEGRETARELRRGEIMSTLLCTVGGQGRSKENFYRNIADDDDFLYCPNNI